ncbi:MAG: hypothetical protein AAF206_22495 [Bacteroidota bacterium]
MLYVHEEQIKGSGSHYPYVLIFAMLLSMLLAAPTAKAAYDMDSIPSGISYPAGLFQAGDTITYSIWAGNSGFVLDEVIGYKFRLSLTNDAVFPDRLIADLSNSWIGTANQLNPQSTVDASQLEIELEGSSVELSSEGYGEVLSFSLVCATNNVYAGELLAAFGPGGNVLIQIDDTGFRLASVPEPMLFPNPTSGKVNIRSADSRPFVWKVLDMQGKERARGRDFPIDLHQLGVPPGQCILRLFGAGRERHNYILLFLP